MSLFTAIVLSAKPVTLVLPGVQVLGCTQVLRSAADLHSARLDALAKVQTPYCFYLDDDDELPDDYLSVLAECEAKMRERGVPMAYTEEILREPGKSDVRRSWYEYDNDRHAVGPMALHHLVVMETVPAQEVARGLPRGNFWTEHMLYWALGRQGGVGIWRVGYIWNRNPKGFSRDPRTLTAQVLTGRWIAQQRGAEHG